MLLTVWKKISRQWKLALGLKYYSSPLCLLRFASYWSHIIKDFFSVIMWKKDQQSCKERFLMTNFLHFSGHLSIYSLPSFVIWRPWKLSQKCQVSVGSYNDRISIVWYVLSTLGWMHACGEPPNDVALPQVQLHYLRRNFPLFQWYMFFATVIVEIVHGKPQERCIQRAMRSHYMFFSCMKVFLRGVSW